MKASAFALGFLIAAWSGSSTAAAVPRQSAIKEIISEFQSAITSKDKERFLSLFLDPNRTSWQPVNGDSVVVTKRTKDPGVVKAKSNPNSTPASFIETVASRAAASEEPIDNIRIGGDEDVATVSFDYRFKLDGKLKNTGTEHWLLVRTEQGWRISSAERTG